MSIHYQAKTISVSPNSHYPTSPIPTSGGVHRGASRLQVPLCAVRTGQKIDPSITIWEKAKRTSKTKIKAPLCVPSAQDKNKFRHNEMGEREKRNKKRIEKQKQKQGESLDFFKGL
jgi:hypothetical protein